MAVELVLYTNPMSRGRIARWMLEEIGQPYEAVVLDYATTMKAPDYLALNPMGKVPCLTHGSRIVTENGAICCYLADAFPEAGLMPADRSSFYRWMFFGAGPVEAAVTDRALGVEVPAERRGFVGYGTFGLMLDTLEGAAKAAAPYLCGEQFTAVDVFLGSQIGFGLRFNTIEARPALTAYWDRISARPAKARASAIDDALLAGG